VSEKLYGFLDFSEKSANGREGHGTWSGDGREKTGEVELVDRRMFKFLEDFPGKYMNHKRYKRKQKILGKGEVRKDNHLGKDRSLETPGLRGHEAISFGQLHHKRYKRKQKILGRVR